MKKKILAAALCMLIVCTATAVMFACGGTATYTVTYTTTEAAATGEAPKDNTKYKEGATVTLAENTLILKDYHFVGWNDGEETYKAGAEYTMPAQDVTFTAVWELDGYAVTYHINNDYNSNFTLIRDEHQYQEGDEIFLIDQPETFIDKNGRAFTGWFNKEDGVVYAAQESYTIPAHNVDFYANWVAFEVKATFYRNDSTDKDETIAYPINDDGNGNKSVNITLPMAPEREGYDFLGWFRSDSEEEPFTAESALSENELELGAVALFARWEQRYTVKYQQSSDGGKTYTDEKTYSKNEPIVLKHLSELPEDWKEEGKEFRGWSLKGSTYRENDTYRVTETDSKTIVFTAVWEITSLKVTFYSEKNQIYKTEYYHFENPIDLPTPPEKDENRFGGWVISNTEIPFDESYEFTNRDKEIGELEVYAKWLQPHTVIYQRNIDERDSVFKTDETTYYAGDTVMLMELPEDWESEDMQFSCWEVNEERFQQNGTFTVEENSDGVIVVYAIWIHTKINVYFDSDENAYDGVPTSIPIGADIVTPAAPTREDGATFLGWYVYQTGARFDGSYQFTDDDKESGELFVYAKWDLSTVVEEQP